MEAKVNATPNAIHPDAIRPDAVTANSFPVDNAVPVSNAAAGRVRRPRRQVYLRACPHCGGDVRLARDIYGASWQCLQCSREIRPAVRPESAPLPATTPPLPAHATTAPPERERLAA